MSEKFLKQELIRSYLPDRTVGFIKYGDGLTLKTLELKWDDNKVNESCIPEGTYIVRPDSTGRQRFYRFDYVPNRTHIESHPAADTNQLLGCQSYGKAFTPSYRMIDSEEGMNEYVSACAGLPVILTIRHFNPATDKWPD